MPVSEIFIHGTDTDPAAGSRAGDREVHRRLRAELADLTAGESPTAADLVEFGLHELRPYLAAAERDLYARAASQRETYFLSAALRTAAAVLDRLIDELASAGDGDAARIGMVLAGAFEVQLTLEEAVLIPALTGDLPVRARGDRIDEPEVIDVRRIARGGRHPRVFFRYARLLPGEAFVLVHSHDPIPLRREFETMHPGAFSWDYQMTGPDEWRVRIGKLAADG